MVNGNDTRRRRFLVTAMSVAGGAATAVAAVPFVESMLPSERAKAAGAPVEVDIAKIAPEGQLVVPWRGRPVWIVNRTQEMLNAVREDDEKVVDPHSEHSMQPSYCKNEYRSAKPGYLVVVGICTHLGCSPVARFARQPESFDSEWRGGFYCPCHGSLYDLAGRVYRNKPAPTNLVVPPYRYVTATTVVIGEDPKPT